MKYAVLKSFSVRDPIPGKKWMKWDDLLSKNSKTLTLPKAVFEVFSAVHKKDVDAYRVNKW